MAKKEKHKARSIVTGHLEKISAKVFDDFSSVITDLIKGHQGIYALFKKDRLYYVGLAGNLKGRIHSHNTDRHQNKWTHFSLYIVRKEDHIREIESLVLRIAYPKGNSIKGKLKQSEDLRPSLKKMLIAARPYCKSDCSGFEFMPVKDGMVGKLNEFMCFNAQRFVYASGKSQELLGYIRGAKGTRKRFKSYRFDDAIISRWDVELSE